MSKHAAKVTDPELKSTSGSFNPLSKVITEPRRCLCVTVAGVEHGFTDARAGSNGV